jgi:hypothetical protein
MRRTRRSGMTQRHATKPTLRNSRETFTQRTHATDPTLVAVALKPLVIAIEIGAAGVDFALLMVAA